MKKNLQLLCAFALTMITCTAQETTEPVLKSSNRIILHFDDTTGLFTRIGRLLMDRGYDIEFKDREFGILRMKPKIYYTEYNSFAALKTIFRDSTVILYSDFGFDDYIRDVKYTTQKGLLKGISTKTWTEMMKIAELLKPKTITYSRFE
jgi:hypothetical protein